MPAVREAIAAAVVAPAAQDFYADPVQRAQLFERDAWRCRYCGEQLHATTATLSIKSGRTVEEAAPQILVAVQRRRSGESSDDLGGSPES